MLDSFHEECGVGGGRLEIGDWIDVAVSDVLEAWGGAVERALRVVA